MVELDNEHTSEHTVQRNDASSALHGETVVSEMQYSECSTLVIYNCTWGELAPANAVAVARSEGGNQTEERREGAPQTRAFVNADTDCPDSSTQK